jgi:predicted enzyme involved in methoxymalonyl-ACP biosynthesis
MFSCRIQSKRVEHAFLTYLIKKYITERGADIFINYRKTARNAPWGRVFDDFGLDKVEERHGVASLVFRKGREVPDDGIVQVAAEE